MLIYIKVVSIKVKVIHMTIKEKIIQMAKENNGIITTSMLTKEKISRGNLKYLYDHGIPEKSTRGVYTIPEAWEDEMFNLQNQFKKGIYSHETALFLLNLTDRTPNTYHMTFPATYNVTKPKQLNIKCTQCQKEFYTIGIITTTTPNGNSVFTYNAERTLCDILRIHNHIDIQIISDAFKQYVTKKDKNIPLLSEYAKLFKVEKKLRSYLEVLL